MTDTPNALRTPDDRFAELSGFDFEPNYIETLEGYEGLRMHYLDEGPAESGKVFLFLGDGLFQSDRMDSSPVLSVSYAGPDLEAVRAADLDGDGLDEILVSVSAPGLVILKPRLKPDE